MNTFYSALLANQALTLKIAGLSDPHMFPQYDPYHGPTGYCWPGTDATELDLTAHFGQYGCDPPPETIRILFEKLRSDHPDLDVILLTGDIVAHAIPLESPPYESQPTASYQELLQILSQFAELLHEYFPNVVVLPSQGNNDTRYHYQPAWGDYSSDYYRLLYKWYFAEHPANSELAGVESTFLRGAYFRAQIADYLSVVSLNTLPYNDRSVTDATQLKIEQLEWFAELLESAGTKEKFILISHIYETVGGSYENWTEDDYQLAYFRLLWEHRDKILVEVAGHDHIADFRSHSAFELFDKRDKCLERIRGGDGFFAAKMINPGLTPMAHSQPGYVVMEYDEFSQTLGNVTATYLDLESTFGLPRNATFNDFFFHKVSFEDFGLSDLSAEGIANLNKRLNQSLVLFEKFLASKKGFTGQERNSDRIDYNCMQMSSMFLAETQACVRNEGSIPLCALVRK